MGPDLSKGKRKECHFWIVSCNLIVYWDCCSIWDNYSDWSTFRVIIWEYWKIMDCVDCNTKRWIRDSRIHIYWEFILNSYIERISCCEWSGINKIKNNVPISYICWSFWIEWKSLCNTIVSYKRGWDSAGYSDCIISLINYSWEWIGPWWASRYYLVLKR